MGIIRIVRDPHNLSVSRLHSFFGCAFRSGCESFFAGERIQRVAFWLPGGTATHAIDDEIVKSSVEKGIVLSDADVKKIVESAKGRLWQVLLCKIPAKGFDPKRIQDIMWMPDEESDKLEPDQYDRKVREKISRYINQVKPGIEALAMRYTVKSPFWKVESGVGFKLHLTSPRNKAILIPVWGEIDLLEWLSDRRVVMTDWKTGNFNNYLQEDLEANDQMLVYWHAVQKLYGVDPLAAYFVSINIFRNDLDRYGPATLEQSQYRVQARIRFSEHFQELLREFDDVWAVLNFLAYPPQTDEQRREMDVWQPSSEKGRRFGLRHHVDQGRLIPSIGRHCGMCPSKAECQRCNPEDWQVYIRNQKLGNVVDRPIEVPEEWQNPLERQDLPLPQAEVEKQNTPLAPQLRLFAPGRPQDRSKLSAAAWRKLGFYTPKEILAACRRMMSLIPVKKGKRCSCVKTGRIHKGLMEFAPVFIEEREAHKQAQEAAGKTRSGTGKQKVRDLYESELVCKFIENCEVSGCIHARKKEEKTT